MLRREPRREEGGSKLGVPPFRYPPSVPLALTPTPIERLEGLSHDLGVEIDVKRDDLTGLALTGNKVRKLEFLLAAAHDARCDTVITCGGTQSNHARATAIAAAKLGMSAHLVLRTADARGTPAVPPDASEGNLFLARLAGASVRYISRERWPERDAIMREDAARFLADEKRRSYVIPEGGSNALGAFGYIRCAEEIALHEQASGRAYDWVVCATGSGGTQAGLIAGRTLFRRPWNVLGFAVCDDATHFRNLIGQVLLDFTTHFSLHLAGAENAIDVDDRYIGGGYGVSSEEERTTIHDLAETEGLFLDPVYTGKAFYGLLAEIRAGRIARGARVLFVHTGGIFGLLAKGREFTL